MSSKWASLNFDGGASPATQRKASLLRSASKSISSVTEAATAPLQGSWGLATLVLVVAVVAVIVNINKKDDAAAVVSMAPPLAAPFPARTPAAAAPDVGVLVNSTVVPEDAAPQESEVLPKFAVSDRFFSQNEGPSDAFLNNNSFKEFQSAFFSRNEKPVLDKETVSDFAGSFVGLQDYLQTHDVPEKLLSASMASEAKNHEVPSVFGGNSDLSDSEARMLASEAFQMIPNGSTDVIISVLHEILSAYTEASKLGLSLPQSPEEQVKSLMTLSKRAGPVGDLAKQILSRI